LWIAKKVAAKKEKAAESDRTPRDPAAFPEIYFSTQIELVKENSGNGSVSGYSPYQAVAPKHDKFDVQNA